MKLFSVKINDKNVVTSFFATVSSVLLSYSRLTKAMHLLVGIHACKTFTSMVTKNEIFSNFNVLYFVYEIIGIFNL